jgi:DNA-binding Lrp family transcriptional regulator
MSAGCYVLARFSDLEKLSLAAQELQSNDDVARWDAVEGHVQLVMNLRTPVSGIPSKIMTMPGVSDLFVYEILTAAEAKERDASLLYAYVFIEIEKGKRTLVSAALKAAPEVFLVDETEGGCDLVVLVEGNNFEALDRFVNEEINSIEGILRIKYNRVIDLIGL